MLHNPRWHRIAAVAIAVACPLAALVPATSPASPGSRPATAAPPTPTQSFALRLWQQLDTAKPSGNLVVSAYSVAEAFSMLAAGARGRTLTEMESVLAGRTRRIDHASRQTLRDALTAQRLKDSGMVTRVANSLWTMTGYPLEAPFTQTVKRRYGAQLAALDFAKSGDAAATINRWIDGVTEGLISELVPASVLDELTRAVLVNAVYFRGRWLDEFDAQRTAPAAFRLRNGITVNVATMRGVADVRPGPSVTVVTLPYVEGTVMRVAMPNASTTAALRAAMAALHRSPEGPEPCPGLPIALPKWTARTTADLVPLMQGLGVRDVFDARRADLTGVSSRARREGLFVSDALHEATITVDEEGTVAAAATALVARATSAPVQTGPCPESFAVERPFVYVIQHRSTGEILFAGRVLDPSAA